MSICGASQHFHIILNFSQNVRHWIFAALRCKYCIVVSHSWKLNFIIKQKNNDLLELYSILCLYVCVCKKNDQREKMSKWKKIQDGNIFNWFLSSDLKRLLFRLFIFRCRHFVWLLHSANSIFAWGFSVVSLSLSLCVCVCVFNENILFVMNFNRFVVKFEFAVRGNKIVWT